MVMLYVGYYDALEGGDIETIVFIKKHSTLHIKFLQHPRKRWGD